MGSRLLAIEGNVDGADTLSVVRPEAGRPGQVAGLLIIYVDRPPT